MSKSKKSVVGKLSEKPGFPYTSEQQAAECYNFTGSRPDYRVMWTRRLYGWLGVSSNQEVGMVLADGRQFYGDHLNCAVPVSVYKPNEHERDFGGLIHGLNGRERMCFQQYIWGANSGSAGSVAGRYSDNVFRIMTEARNDAIQMKKFTAALTKAALSVSEEELGWEEEEVAKSEERNVSVDWGEHKISVNWKLPKGGIRTHGISDELANPDPLARDPHSEFLEYLAPKDEYGYNISVPLKDYERLQGIEKEYQKISKEEDDGTVLIVMDDLINYLTYKQMTAEFDMSEEMLKGEIASGKLADNFTALYDRIYDEVFKFRKNK